MGVYNQNLQKESLAAKPLSAPKAPAGGHTGAFSVVIMAGALVAGFTFEATKRVAATGAVVDKRLDLLGGSCCLYLSRPMVETMFWNLRVRGSCWIFKCPTQERLTLGLASLWTYP